MEERNGRETHEDTGGRIGLTWEAFWPALKKRWWVAVVVAVLVSALHYANAVRTYQPQYRTSSTFTVSVSNNYGSSTKTYNNAMAKQMAKTFPYVLQSGVLSEMVANDLGYRSLPGSVSATALEETNLFTLTVTAADPQLAYDILQAVIRNYPQVAEFVVGTTNLVLLEEEGVVTDPINAVSWQAAVKQGVMVGLLVGAAAVLLYIALNQTVRRVDDLKRLSNVKCMAVIPQVRHKKRSRASSGLLITQKRAPRGFVEAIYRLRAGVEKSGAKVLLVSSALAGEGKTTMTVNLALSLAKQGNRVVLIDGDLRHPSVGQQLGVSGRAVKAGLAEYLQGKATIEQIGFTVSNLNGLVVIPGGAVVKNASELLDRPALSELIDAMRSQADYILIDSPPCCTLADSAVAGRCADGILYVVRQNYASRDRVLRGMDNVSTSGTPLVGCVLNSTAFNPLDYGYGGYYYGRYGYGRYGYGYYGGTSDSI